MKFCDRCYIEYEDEEIVQFDKESPKWICLPCKWEFDARLKVFLIDFFNDQPERSKREDVFVVQGSTECIAIDAIPSKECKEYHENSYIQINGQLRRCGALNTVETQ